MTDQPTFIDATLPLGRIVATPGAAALGPELLAACLARHASGDWGCVDDDDDAANDVALDDGSRILSAYPIDPAKPCAGHGDNCLWIITEAADDAGQRAATTLLLPAEY